MELNGDVSPDSDLEWTRGDDNGSYDNSASDEEIQRAAGDFASSSASGIHQKSPPVSSRGAPSADTKKRQAEEATVQQRISQAKQTGAIDIDLCRLGISTIPEELLQLSSLQFLYLEENNLKSLPENFFDCLPELQWLDLRQNYLTNIPSTYIGRHKHLRNLLLEGNELKTLPLELGLVPTLTGLNITNNPLEFPPQSVVEAGARSVLEFLRDLIRAKSEAQSIAGLEDLHLRDSRDAGGWTKASAGKEPVTRTSSAVVTQESHSAPSERKAQSGPSTSKRKKKGVPAERKLQPRDFVVSRFPEPPPADRVEKRYREERKLARIRDTKEKQEVILQKRKDTEALKGWRGETKKLQYDKYREAQMYGGAKNPVDVAKQSPFGVSEEEMKVMTNKERIARDVRKKHEKMRRALSPASRYKREMAKKQKEKELETRVRDHTKNMEERRRRSQHLTPKQEMLVAQRELQVAEELHREIEARRKALEYGFPEPT